MQRTVQFRPDQPLFKARAFHIPLWIHAPAELARGIGRWLTASLRRDNPHRNQLHNPTLTKAAKMPHRLSFWTGQPVFKPAKWHTLMRRWGLVFALVASIKYLPGSAWVWLLKQLGSGLKWIGLEAIPWGWGHLWWLPVIAIGTAFAVWLCMWTVRKVAAKLHDRAKRKGEGTDRYALVLSYRDWLASTWRNIRRKR